jgi:hypothetical protein
MKKGRRTDSDEDRPEELHSISRETAVEVQGLEHCRWGDVLRPAEEQNERPVSRYRGGEDITVERNSEDEQADR